jgi:hypothetical protein
VKTNASSKAILILATSYTLRVWALNSDSVFNGTDVMARRTNSTTKTQTENVFSGHKNRRRFHKQFEGITQSTSKQKESINVRRSF